MKRCLIIAVVATLVGCATPYQQRGATGGFSTSQLDVNVFQVTFRGNGFTDREKASDFTLLKSAELTIEHGYKYFVIVDAQQYSKDNTFQTPMTATTNINTNTSGYANTYGNTTSYTGNTYGTANTTISGGQTLHISKPRASNTIVCYKDKPSQGFSYNAEIVAKSLKQKYGLQPPEAKQLRVTTKDADVAGCTMLSDVSGQPPYLMPGDSQKSLENAAAGRGADTLFVTSYMFGKGIAYRCGK